MRKRFEIKHLCALTFVGGVGLVSAAALEAVGQNPGTALVSAPSLDGGAAVRDDEVVFEAVSGFRPDGIATGSVTATAIPDGGELKPGSRLTGGTRAVGSAPNALELEKLALARTAIAEAEAAGTRAVDLSGTDLERRTTEQVLAEKERRARSLEPMSLDHVPGGVR